MIFVNPSPPPQPTGLPLRPMALLLHQPLLPEGSTAAAVGSPLPSRSWRGGEGQQHGDALEVVTSPPLSSSSPPPPLPSPIQAAAVWSQSVAGPKRLCRCRGRWRRESRAKGEEREGSCTSLSGHAAADTPPLHRRCRLTSSSPPPPLPSP